MVPVKRHELPGIIDRSPKRSVLGLWRAYIPNQSKLVNPLIFLRGYSSRHTKMDSSSFANMKAVFADHRNAFHCLPHEATPNFHRAPPPSSLPSEEGDFKWETLTTTAQILDAPVFEAASRLWNVILSVDDDEDSTVDASDSNLLDGEHNSRMAETFITWSPTQNRTKGPWRPQIHSQESTIDERQELGQRRTSTPILRPSDGSPASR